MHKIISTYFFLLTNKSISKYFYTKLALFIYFFLCRVVLDKLGSITLG